MSNISGGGGGGSFSSGGEEDVQQQQQQILSQFNSSNSSTSNTNGSQQQNPPPKKKRNLPGNPDPSAEVVALSPTTLMATNRFVCEICNKGFQRDQNLQLHRRGHNLPWKLRQRTTTEIRKRVYICPEPSCVHHNPARALGDLTGIKKHYCRKHGEKKWKCDKCSKRYAVQSDWKAHSKTCGTREYKCDCGTIFSRRDSFITHRAFCDALAEENNKESQGLLANLGANFQDQVSNLIPSMPLNNTSIHIPELSRVDSKIPSKSPQHDLMPMPPKNLNMGGGNMFSSSTGSLFGSPRSMSSSTSCLQLSANFPSNLDGLDDAKNLSEQQGGTANMSATALLQKAAQMGATASSVGMNSSVIQKSFLTSMAPSSFGDQIMQAQNGQSQIMGHGDGGSFNASQFMQKGASLETMVPSQLFGHANGTGPNSGGLTSNHQHIGMFSDIFDQNNGFSKNLEYHDNNNGHGMLLGRNLASGFGASSRFATANGGSDMTTVDFLGVRRTEAGEFS
ncbi:Zinc finger C2H2-type [Dillenia turbinata]|uniref:Zinc finger C2H2-type n=1 Tax=Dillenia turbinata TaxID=194707 RepID=A0AAN8YT14_9MAGN